MILSNEAQPVSGDDAVSSRHFGGSGVKTSGIFGIGRAENPPLVTTPNADSHPSDTEPPFTPGPTITQSPPLPTTDTSMIRGKHC